MTLIVIGLLVVMLCVGFIAGGLFGFHCGYIYGRFGISAYEYRKRSGRAVPHGPA